MGQGCRNSSTSIVGGGAVREPVSIKLDEAGGRHDRRMMHAVLREPRERSFGEPRFEQEMFACDPMAHQGPVHVFALLQEELVVQHVVDALLLVARVPRQQRDDGVGPWILGREVQRDPGPEEGAQGLVKAEARIGVPHERRNGDRRRYDVLHTLRDDGLQGPSAVQAPAPRRAGGRA